jgi:hypothetical protein
MMRTLDRSGLKPKDIDRVIRTGGSSQIPLFVRLLNEVFGWQKVREIDVFSSVTSGLALHGAEIASGRDGGRPGLHAHTPANFQGSEGMTDRQASKPEVVEINLAAVRQRLEVRSTVAEGQAGLPAEMLLVAGDGGLFTIPAADLRSGKQSSWSSAGLRSALPEGSEQPGPVHCLLCRPDDHVLLATSGFKLIETTPGALYLAAQLGRQAITDLLRLEPNEGVTAITLWRPAEIQKRSLCMVTRFGQARAFDARLLADHLAKAPFFQLEKRYTGHPVALLPAGEGDTILIGTDQGRVGWAAAADMAVVIRDILRARKDEEVIAAAALGSKASPLALSEAGLALRVPVPQSGTGYLASQPAGGSPAARGVFLRRNFKIVALLPEGEAGDDLLLLSSKACITRLPAGSLILPAEATGAERAVELSAEEKILARIVS